MLQRVEERHRPGEVRGEAVEDERALAQRLPDEAEVQLLEVPQPSVDQLAGAARGARGVVARLDEADPQAAGDGVEGGAGTDDAAADDQDVELLGGHVLQRLPPALRVQPCHVGCHCHTSTQSSVRCTAFCQPW